MKAIENLIYAGKLEKAQEMLKIIPARDSINKRWKLHLEGKILIYSGKFTPALLHLEETRIQHGDHLALLCDIASLLLLHGRYEEWFQLVQEIDETLFKVFPRLSLDTYVRHSFILAKFLEEQGKILESAGKYFEILHIADKMLPSSQIRIKSNLMRIRVLWNIDKILTPENEKICSPSIETIYETLNEIPLKSLPAEAGHALCLAELYLFGHQIAELRLAAFQKIFGESEYRSVITDLIEICIRNCKKVPQIWRYRFLQLAPQNKLEQLYFDYLNNFYFRSNTWSENLPPQILLRTQALVDFSAFNTSLSKINMAEGTKSIWNQFYRDMNKTNLSADTLQLDFLNYTLEHGGKTLSFADDRFQFILLTKLIDYQIISASDIVKSVWNSEDDRNMQTTLDLTVQTINRKIKAFFGKYPYVVLKNNFFRTNTDFEVLTIKK